MSEINPNDLKELIPFISDPRAADQVFPYLLSLTSSPSGCQSIIDSGCLPEILKVLQFDTKNPHIGTIFSTLINLSSVDALLSPALFPPDLLVALVSDWLVSTRCLGELSGLALILLSNLTSRAPFAHAFLAAQPDDALLRCVAQLVLQGEPSAASCWLHQLLSNLTQLRPARRFLLDAAPARLVPYLRLLDHHDLVTRRAAAQLLRNCLFETDQITSLLTIPSSSSSSSSSSLSSSSSSSSTSSLSAPLLLVALVRRMGAEEDPGVFILVVEALALAAMHDAVRAHLGDALFQPLVSPFLEQRKDPALPEWRVNALNRFALALAGDVNSPTQDGLLIQAAQAPDDQDDDDIVD